MYQKLLATAASAMILTSPAMAATTNLSAMTPVRVAPAPAASLEKVTHHIHGKKLSMAGSQIETSEVHALNALEAAGYRQFADLHANGTDFIGTAQKGGKTYDVTVTPSGNIKAANT